jgi:hypothetical protein
MQPLDVQRREHQVTSGSEHAAGLVEHRDPGREMFDHFAEDDHVE